MDECSFVRPADLVFGGLADVHASVVLSRWLSPLSSRRGGEKTKSFAVISSQSNEGMKRGSLGARGVGGLASHAFTSSRGGGVRGRSRPAGCRRSQCCPLRPRRREPVCRHRELSLGR